MAIIKMKKVTAYVMRSEARKVTRALQKAGVMEIDRKKGDDMAGGNQARVAETDAALSRVRAAEEILRHYDHTKKSFLAPKPPATADELMSEGTTDAIEEILATADDIEKNMAAIRASYAQAVNAENALMPFAGLSAPTRDIADTAHVSIYCGFLPKESMELLQGVRDRFEGLLVVELLEEVGEFTPCLVCAHKSVAQQARTALKELAFSDAKLAADGGTVKEQMDDLELRRKELDESRAAEEERAQKTASGRPLLAVYDDRLSNELARETAIDAFSSTDKVSIISGWIRHYDAESLESAIKAVTDDYYLDIEDPADDDDVPTAIVNSKQLTPFEAITDMYSTPAYNGIDPVYILAPFYFLFFGMMVSDAIYGLLLTIGATVVLKVKKPDGMFRKITTVLAICGISTFIWGALFGGWMGFDSNDIPWLHALWFNPLDQPMQMLYLCVAVGVVHLLVALGCGFYMLCRDGHPWAAIFDKGLWMIVLLAIPVMLINGNAALIMVIVAGAGLVLTQGRDKKGVVRKFFGGLASLYDVTGYLSDILSYCRIFGMSMATTVIAMVFKTIAGMLMGSIIGWVFGAVVFLAGNLFNLGINALGAYVHSSRLQYIESFNKFFEAGGREFRPLSVRAKHNRIADEGGSGVQ